MEEGVLFLEPEIEGYPVGAFFEGRATVSFAPSSGKAKGDLDYFSKGKGNSEGKAKGRARRSRPTGEIQGQVLLLPGARAR